jgi:hypothetical protein
VALTAFAVTGSAWAAQAHADTIQSCHEGFCGTPTINLLPSGSAGITPTATPAPAPVKPVASPVEDSAAMSAFAGEFGAATAVGGFGGTVAGAVIGCAVGGIVTAPTIVFVPAGCPALALAGADLVGTLTAPAGTTKWAQR